MNSNIGSSGGGSGGDGAGKIEVLIAELEIFEEAIWRSEDTGEKRFNFFVTLITAAAAGIVALWSADSLSDAVEYRRAEISAYVCGVLLIFGLLTLMRMNQRDRVTAQYKRSTWYIRDLYRTAIPGLEYVRLPRPKNPADAREAGFDAGWSGKVESRWEKFKKGGYAVSLGAINGILLTATMMFAWTWHECYVLIPLAAGLIFGGFLCWYGSETFPSGEEDRPVWPPS